MPHTPIQQLDIGRVNRNALNAALGQTQLRGAVEKQRREKQFNALAPGIASGDPDATRRGAALNPQGAVNIQTAIANMDGVKRKEVAERADFIGKAALGILSAPEEQQPALYSAALAQAQQRGFDISGLPQQFSPELVPQLQTFVGQAMTIGEQLKQIAGQGPLSGPGKVQADIDAGRLPAGTPLRSAAVQVNTGRQGQDFGDPPKGFAWARDDAGNVVTQPDAKTGFLAPVAVQIQEGPAQRKEQQTGKKREQKTQQRVGQANIVTEDIGRAIELTEGASVPVTGVGSLLSGVPGTTARDLDALLNTIKANVGFDKLQAMREASPTGGALGQVSENENRLLQSVLGSMEQSQSQDQFLFNLRRLNETFLDIIHGPGNRPPTAQAPPAAAPQPSITPGQGVPSQTQAPPGVPPGSTQVGTRNGNPVWQAPDGRRFEVTP